MAAAKARCDVCNKPGGVTVTLAGFYRKHDGELKGIPCPNSGKAAPVESHEPEGTDPDEGVSEWESKFPVCPECNRRPAREKDGTFRLHMNPAGSQTRCPMSGKPAPSSTPSTSGTSATTADPASTPSPEPTTPTPSTAGAATAAPAPKPPKESPAAPRSMPTSSPVPVVPPDPIHDEYRPPGDESWEQATPVEPEVRTVEPDSPAGKVIERLIAEDEAVDLAAHQLDAYRTKLLPTSYNTGWQYQGFQQPGAPDGVPVRVELDDGRTMHGTAVMRPDGSGTGVITPDFPQWPFQQPARLPDQDGEERALIAEAVDVPAFQQPAGKRGREKSTAVMTPFAQQIADTMKAIFFAHAQTGRSAQHSIGPSEHGTPCDRRLVMRMLGLEPVNPGGDGWAAFVGTCIHAGLADMLTQVSGNSGRFAVEMPLTFPSNTVPHGTGDLLDRVFFCFDDHKAMGEWSLNKLRENGPSVTYRKQVQTYAYGASIAGETIKRVAIIAWPRASSSLDDLWVWEEPYDPAIGRDSLKRADQLAEHTHKLRLDGASVEDIAGWASIDNSDCRFCPFHKPKSTNILNGCNGKDM